MNIELRRRIAPLLPRVSSGVNDNTEERPNARPQHRVIIFKPAKSTITSGRARRKQWLLKFEPQSAPFIEPLMGWTGSTDPLASMQLGFSSRDAAIAYAERQGLEYEVREPALRPGAPERRADHQPNPLAAPLMPVGSGVTPLKVDLAA